MAMIINHARKFCFLHIPKCAGSTIRNQIMKFDQTNGQFIFHIAEHPILGRIQYAHLPLHVLDAYFCEAYEAVRTYESFAITRAPVLRFQSAFAERCRKFLGASAAGLSPRERSQEIDKVIRHLTTRPDFPEPEFCHFSRQSDFIFLNGEKIVKNIFPIERMDAALEAMSLILQKNLTLRTDNSTRAFRNRFLEVALVPLWRATRKYIPERQKRLLNIYVAPRVTKPLSGDTFPEIESQAVTDFIHEFYKEDFSLYAESVL